MRRFGVLAVLLLAFSLLAASDLGACGDKLLLLGRGARYSLFHPASQPQSILLYRNQGLTKGVGVNDPTLEAALKRVGHKLRVANDLNQVNQALKSVKLDMVVADSSAVGFRKSR